MSAVREYYYRDLNRLYKFLIPKDKSNYILLNNQVGDVIDVQKYFSELRKKCRAETRLVISYYNYLWEPVLKLASFLGWRRQTGEQNWLDSDDIKNLLDLADFEVINRGRRLLLPVEIPLVSNLINKWIAHLPIINSFCLVTWLVARPKIEKGKDYSVTIVIPARNEAGNIPKIVKSIPKFGKWQEIIFVEGHSKDETWDRIQTQLKKTHRRGLKVAAYKQRGKGKADAVRLGFEKARGEMLMILDADLTVDPKDLPKFYEVLASGKGEFANGSRMVYPMEKQAMRALNMMGNKVFSWLFTWILGQRFKDTLCGTKVLFRKDYANIVKGRKFFGDFDPFGDYDLIFGAVKQNLKVVEVPIRYRERTYGSTNISRFTHGWLLLKMTWFAFRKFRAW